MAIVEVTADNFPGSALTGSGSDTLKLVGNGIFDFAYVTFSGFSAIVFDNSTVRISGEQLGGVSSISSTTVNNLYRPVELTGSNIDLSGKTFTNIRNILIDTDNAVVTVDNLSLGLKLDASERQGERIVLNGIVSTPTSRDDLHNRGFDTIIEGQKQWTNAAPTMTGIGGSEKFHVRAGESVLLDPEGDSIISNDDGPIATLEIDLSGSGYYDPMSNFEFGQNFKIVEDSIDQNLLYNDIVIARISSFNDKATIHFNQSASSDIINEFVRSLAYAPGNFVYYSDVSITLTALDKGSRKAEAVVYVYAEHNWTPTKPKLDSTVVVENASAGTVVGTLKATDANDDPVNYRLLDDAGGRFSIQGDKLVVSGKAPIDYEAAKDHTVKVIANDGERDGQPGTFVISVIDVADTSTPASPAVGQTRIGTSRTDRLSGTGGNDILKGRAGNDVLKGLAGDDQLWGEAGKDVLYGGAGKDIFVFNTKLNKKTNLDKIADFNVKDDTIWLDNRYMSKLGKGTALKPGKLNKKFFTIGNKAKDKNDYLVYDKKKGVLYYDSDGSGSHKAVEIATLKKNLKMTYHDFMVI